MSREDDIRALRRSVSEPAAFDALFVAHHVAIRRYLHARVGDGAVAEDLAAETFVRAFAARARFRDQGYGVRAWLFQIATNLLRDELRARGMRERGMVRGAGSVAPPELPSDPALTAQLRALPHEQLEVLLLFAWADLGYEDIAAVLGVRVGTVRSRLHRARAQLQRTLTAPAVRATARPERSTT
ncbi:MAG TPA: sigma-70 family RNA polymerase sigma factor [Baekduia sp.]|jgi:RNA polymerase sigma-70 factor (ECF subfamily)